MFFIDPINKYAGFSLFLSALLFFASSASARQLPGDDTRVIELDKVKKNDALPQGEAIIYGTFIQRLGFSSGGFPQDIILMNTETGEVVSFRVKPTYKSAKENDFFFHITPGDYEIVNYLWTQSKWYGGEMYQEPIFKNVDSRKLANVPVNDRPEKLKRFRFSIVANTINYVGTWHFDTGVVSFSNNLPDLDPAFFEKFSKLDFSKSIVSLPY